MGEYKKLMLLGGSAQQIVAIETAKRLGHETILCDYLSDNPGQHYADKFYQVSTTDKEAVYEVAIKENIDGILAYASDPAAPTAAYVAEKMGLPTNDSVSVEILCSKDKFRKFLRDNGFNAPKAIEAAEISVALDAIDQLRMPVVIKPVDSSGSKGVTVLRDGQQASRAIESAFSFSRAKKIIIEEFIEKKHKYLVGGDIFVIDGQIVLWGLLNCHRDDEANPLVPVGKSYPLLLSEDDKNRVMQTLQNLVNKLNIKSGAMNVEAIVDSQGEVWLIDVGPRNGGNMIPDLLKLIFGVDVVELSVRNALGETIGVCNTNGTPYYATHNLHTNKSGIYQGIEFSAEISAHIVDKKIYKSQGDSVEFFDNASKAIGIVFLKFDRMEDMLRTMENINSHIHICLQ